MKKLNKKGFTLIELLAVIVVLAIIMVIATQQVNKTIKKSRGNAFYETAQSIYKSMETVCAMDNKVTTATLKDQVKATDVSISYSGGKFVVKSNTTGKFANQTEPDNIDSNTYTYTDNKDGTYSFSFTPECPASE